MKCSLCVKWDKKLKRCKSDSKARQGWDGCKDYEGKRSF